MLELAWFAAGAVGAAVAVHLAHRHRAGRAAAASSQARTATPPPEPNRGPDAPVHQQPANEAPAMTPARGPSGERVAAAVAEELANLVSGIDQAANDLVACAPLPQSVPRAAERFASEVRRLVVLHRKLELLGEGLAVATAGGASDLEEVLASLGEALQQSRFGLQIQRDLPPGLPRVAIAADALRELLLFACSAMFHKSGATRLCVAAEPALEHNGHLRVELMLEWCGEPARETITEPALASIEHDAARCLARSHGGTIDLRRCPNGAVGAVLELPAVAAAPVGAAGLPATAPPIVRSDAEAALLPRHRFGGALVIENDPAIRAMLARELRIQGRAVFACADAGAARAFLQATPERFEVLILDDDRRLTDGDELGAAIRTLLPTLKICLLGQPGPHADRDWPRMQSLKKPFGVDELRRGLAAILDAS